MELKLGRESSESIRRVGNRVGGMVEEDGHYTRLWHSGVDLPESGGGGWRAGCLILRLWKLCRCWSRQG